MGFRDGIKKPGGGILHNVEGMIRDYAFTTDPPWDVKAGQEDLLYLKLVIRADSSEEDVNQFLFLGSTQYMEVSEDEKTLTSIDRDTTSINSDLSAGKFLVSLLEADFPEDKLPDLAGGEPLNLTGLIGTRVRFVQRVNEALTKEKGKRKAKNGKEYSYTDLVVDAVLSLPTAKGGKPNGAAAKGKPTTKGKPVPADDGDVTELAGETLQTILGREPKGTITLKQMQMKVFGAIQKHPQRDAVIAFAKENPTDVPGIDFDAKTSTFSLSA